MIVAYVDIATKHLKLSTVSNVLKVTVHGCLQSRSLTLLTLMYLYDVDVGLQI